MTEEANNLPEVIPLENTVDIFDQMLADAHNDSAKNDFEQARTNLHDMINNGKDALAKLGEIADSSQHPRAFEVYAKMMDSLLNANKELLNLQTKIREIKNADAPVSEKAKTINQSIFVGSTAELSKLINMHRKGQQEDE